MPFPDMVPALASGAREARIVSTPVPALAVERGVGASAPVRPTAAPPAPVTAVVRNDARLPDVAHRDGAAPDAGGA
jgi:ABC-type nitrate/sulfonate/bicarbonate transport system substrate-binding protein